MALDRMNPVTPDESRYVNCIRCGLCLSVCPTYREYLKETASPRGRTALTRKGLEGELELTPNLIEQMYSCFTCMACDEACPVGIRPSELAISMRHIYEQLHPARWKQWFFSGLVSRARGLERAALPLRLYQKTGARSLVYALGIRRFLPEKIRDLEAMLPPLPRRSLRRMLSQALPETAMARGKANYRVGFFPGCIQSLFFADESAAALRVLARNGCAVIMAEDVKCCGMPARGYGRADLVENQAKHNIEIFERLDIEYILTDCATCGSTLKGYGRIFADNPEWKARAEAFRVKVRDICEFLAAVTPEKPVGRLQGRVTYHDPCHLRRSQKVWKEPRKILSLIDGLDFVELPESDWCCGSAGSQLITHYKTSWKVLNRKLDNVEKTGADILASGCPGCRMQLQTGFSKRFRATRTAHPVALLDEAYGTMCAPNKQ